MSGERDVDIHTFFGLTYANYLVLHRSLLQSMPEDWQHRFVALVKEMDQAFSHVERADSYRVNAIDPHTGRFVKDPVPHYNRGRTRVEPLAPRSPSPDTPARTLSDVTPPPTRTSE